MKPCCRAVQAALLALAAVGAVILLAGVAATHAASNQDEVPLGTRIELFTEAGIPAHESTAWTLGWAWLVVFGNSAAVALAACAAFWVPGLKIGAVALLVLLTAFVAPLCSCFLQLHYSLVGTDYTTTRRAVDCAFSGALISACANILLFLVLGFKHGDCAAPACCCKVEPQEEAKPAAAAAAITATDANAAAFLCKRDQAAAAMV